MTAMVRSSGLQGYNALTRSLGADPVSLLRRHRIPASSLDVDDALLSLRACLHLLESTAAETGCADFGLRLSQMQDIGVLGPLSVVLSNAPTVRQAWDGAARHMFVHTPGLALDIREHSPLAEDASEMALEIRLARPPAHRQTIDLCLGDLHHITRLLAGEQYHLHAVTLPHTPVAPIGTYERFFGAPVFVAQPRAALHVSRGTLQADLRGANQELRKIAQDFLERNFRDSGQSLSSRVRLALRHMLGMAQGSKGDVAALLAVHPRTLQRHLGAEGTTFEQLREEVHKEAALRYLRETDLPLGQLADILGFSEQSAMTRSCRRWFGLPPSALRRAVRRGRMAGDAR
ncbi:AraC family transcriptional regulator [Variovorax sp. GT1P44]|uniref:AraC family transcriptional regulator n=1 Tax=Variovorax sp. GT1P44 TaxID=3443742 RepID=UPI003F48EC65